MAPLASRSAAYAATTDFLVLLTDPGANRVLAMHKNTSSWAIANRQRRITFAAGPWHQPLDVKYRTTTAHGTVAVLACNGSDHGRIGVYDITSDVDTTISGDGDLLYWAAPGGHVHGVERIPNLGLVVSASPDSYAGTTLADGTIDYTDTNGFLKLWHMGSSAKMTMIHKVRFPNAHMVLWDSLRGCLWATGGGAMRRYTISGTGTGARLVQDTTFRLALHSVGHDVQPDYTADPVGYVSTDKLIVTDADGARLFDVPTRTWDSGPLGQPGGIQARTAGYNMKSYVRASTGEGAWTESNITTGSQLGHTHTVHFSESYPGGRSNSGFWDYRVRVATTAFHA